MSNTFSQMYVQIVFATKRREAMIPKKNKEVIHKFITGIVTKRKQKLLAINAMSDHIHIFIGFKPNIRISDLVRDIKTASSQFIRERRLTPGVFNWQNGYGSFTYAQSQISTVCNYIANQEQHHKNETFKQEYLKYLERYEIDYDPKYLFDFFE